MRYYSGSLFAMYVSYLFFIPCFVHVASAGNIFVTTNNHLDGNLEPTTTDLNLQVVEREEEEEECLDSKESFGNSNKMTCRKLRKWKPAKIEKKCGQGLVSSFCPATCGEKLGG